MHETTVLLFHCKPLKAKMTKAACIIIHGKKRGLKFNNDQDGLPFRYEECAKCSGVIGKGESVVVTAGDPPDREPIRTIDGSYQYV